MNDCKKCTGCGRSLPLDDYYRGVGKYGRRSKCKVCTREVNRRYDESRQEYLREYHKEYYRKNRAAINARHRKHYEENKEAYALWNAKWARENRERMRELRRQWSLRHPGKSREDAKIRRERCSLAEGVTLDEQRQARWDYYGGKCYLCGDDATEMDHVIPIARGGSNWPANLRPACRSCNSQKGAKSLADYDHWMDSSSHTGVIGVLDTKVL